ncbi:hypothetical protein C8N47_111112 [Mangrovibacterium marinum]|uniref:Helix-turn-helix protein n=1 Tax=Mangrovibacterium marinum TaxID=1639118 RepID=A0A2T5C0H6_9BACT|nr:hypothetical protein [Mangrovibacterium marinum]PTN08072.1 hypothetical protein C8N47_111112 [Mangrovibacterium marinum]
MADFNKKQIETLRGSFKKIAESVGCTREYVSQIIHGKRKLKRKSPLAMKVIKKANELLTILEPKN